MNEEINWEKRGAIQEIKRVGMISGLRRPLKGGGHIN